MSTFDFLEFRHLKYVEAIADAERFTTAANHLHTSQSSLSTQIKQLEEYFNVQIFIRGRDGVAGLTAAGQVLVAGAKELLHLRDETIHIMLALGTGTPPALRIGFSSLVEKKLLHAMVDLVRALMPTSEVKCDVDDLENLELRVRSGELDTALITLPLEDSPEIRTYVVDKEPLVVCMRSDDPLADLEAIPAHELNGRLGLFEYPQVHPRAHTRLLEMLCRFNVTPKECHPTQNREHVQWMVHEGECYALVRRGRTLMSGLTTRPIHGANWTIDTALIARPSAHHPALALLLREIRRRSWQFNCTPVLKKPPTSARYGRDSRRHKGSPSSAGLPLFEAS